MTRAMLRRTGPTQRRPSGMAHGSLSAPAGRPVRVSDRLVCLVPHHTQCWRCTRTLWRVSHRCWGRW
jgi:hypothetical protein